MHATQFESIVSVFVPFLGGIAFKPCIEKQIGILYAFDSRILQSHRFCILKCSILSHSLAQWLRFCFSCSSNVNMLYGNILWWVPHLNRLSFLRIPPCPFSLRFIFFFRSVPFFVIVVPLDGNARLYRIWQMQNDSFVPFLLFS